MGQTFKEFADGNPANIVHVVTVGDGAPEVDDVVEASGIGKGGMTIAGKGPSGPGM